MKIDFTLDECIEMLRLAKGFIKKGYPVLNNLNKRYNELKDAGEDTKTVEKMLKESSSKLNLSRSIVDKIEEVYLDVPPIDPIQLDLFEDN